MSEQCRCQRAIGLCPIGRLLWDRLIEANQNGRWTNNAGELRRALRALSDHIAPQTALQKENAS